MVVPVSRQVLDPLEAMDIFFIEMSAHLESYHRSVLYGTLCRRCGVIVPMTDFTIMVEGSFLTFVCDGQMSSDRGRMKK